MFLLIKALCQGPKKAVWPLTEGGRLNEAPLLIIHITIFHFLNTPVRRRPRLGETLLLVHTPSTSRVLKMCLALNDY